MQLCKMKRKFKLGYSPCPNDTYIFGALALGLIPSQLDYSITLADVDELNTLSVEQDFDVIKMSYHAFAYQTEHYQMLPYGSALGFGVGPLLISGRKSAVDEIKKVAIPGELTTANFLFDFAYPKLKVEKTVMIFSEIEQAITSGRVDAGVIIHENRFTYQERGFYKIQDLGEYWESKSKLPIPLGGIAIKRGLNPEIKAKISDDLRASISLADRDFSLIEDYVKQYAQEMDVNIMKKHIDLYVNQSTRGLSVQDIESINFLLKNIRNGKSVRSKGLDWLAV